MEHLINKRVQALQVSGIRKFANKVATIQGAISLTIGQPDFATPEHVKEAAKKAIDANKTSYTFNAGLIELRRAVHEFMNNKYSLSYQPDDEIIVTIGASEAIDIALRTILEEGSEVILPAPVYPAYESLIRLLGGVPVLVDTRQSAFKITAQMVAEHITDRTRCLILPYPSNPTGCVLEEQDLKEIADVLHDKEIFVISDEIYSELIYEGEHHSIATQPGMREKTIVLNGLSKSHSMTGWRIGFCCAPKYLTEQMVKVHLYNVSCASSISQYAALEAVTVGADDALEMKQEYRKRRDYVLDRLQQMGFDVVKPNGAFYVFPSIQKWGLTSLEFCTRLVEEQKVAVVPGDAFSECGEGFVRLSYATAPEVLCEALDRMERFVKSL